MALYGDQLFYPATDATLYALDARTGKINWKFKFSSYGSDKIGGLMMADGKLIVGLRRLRRAFAGRTAASSPPMTSRTATRSGNSPPSPMRGEPGGDSWGNMTNGERAGADAWIAGTYDPKLRLIYWGTGQAKAGKNGIGDKLFSNATHRAGRRYRQAQMVQPARAGRRPGPR